MDSRPRAPLAVPPFELQRALIRTRLRADMLPKAVLVVAVLSMALLVAPSARILTSPWPATLGEGIVVAAVQRWLDGAALYPPPLTFNNGIDFPYPPFYAVCLALPLKLGVAPLLAGRLVSALGLLLTVGGIAAATWQVSRNRAATIVGAIALPCVSQAAVVWGLVGRVDSLALGLTTVGMAAWLGDWRGHRLVSLGCLSLALLTKETVVAAPAAIVLALLIQRHWRQALGVIVGVGLPVALVYLWCDHVSNGAFRFDLLTLGTVRPFVLSLFLAELLFLGLWSGPPLGVAAAALFHRSTPLALPLWLLLAALEFLLTVGKIGAAPYYGAELGVIGAIGLGLFFASSGSDHNAAPRRRRQREFVAAIVLAVGAALGVWLSLTSDLAPLRWSTANASAAHTEVVAAMAGTHGPVLSDLAGDLVLAGRVSDVVDLRGLVQLALAGQFDERAVDAQLARGEFSLLALDFDPLSTSAQAMREHADTRLTPAMLSAIQSRYTLDRTIPLSLNGRAFYLLSPKERDQ